jgi:hypothetical protein
MKPFYHGALTALAIYSFMYLFCDQKAHGQQPTILFLLSGGYTDTAEGADAVVANLKTTRIRRVLLEERVWRNLPVLCSKLATQDILIGIHTIPEIWPAGETAEDITQKLAAMFRPPNPAFGFCDGGDEIPLSYEQLRAYVSHFQKFYRERYRYSFVESASSWQVFDLLGGVGSIDQNWNQEPLVYAKARCDAMVAGVKANAWPVWYRKTLGWIGEDSNQNYKLWPLASYAKVWQMASDNGLGITYRTGLSRMARKDATAAATFELIGLKERERELLGQ